MYLKHFKLREYPFRLTPDTEFLYTSLAHRRAMAYMNYCLWNREGFAVLTGEIGSGKTLLIQKLISEINENEILVARIFQTQLNDVEFLQAVSVEFGLSPLNANKVGLIDMLNSFLVESFSSGKQMMLIVDDAHNLRRGVLEEIRMLSGVETQKQKILQVILVGQPALNDTLESPDMEQLLQRVRLRYHIKALSETEVGEYLSHRLRVAGADGANLFAPETIPVIYQYTGGIPRLINTLCDTALICAYADGIARVTTMVLKAAVVELRWLPYVKRISAMKARERAANGGGMCAVNEKREWAFVNISNRLNQLDALTPAMSRVSDRMAHIELLLRDLAGSIQGNHRGAPLTLKTSQREK